MEPAEPKFNQAAHDAMSQHEVEYLVANGWVNVAEDLWTSEQLERERLRQGHAVNCQKQFDRLHLQGIPWRQHGVQPLIEG
jgi:hypothetical protein